MSYILDALRKADAERERGVIPDLHAQPLAGGAREFGLTERSGVPWGWLLAGAGVVLVAAMAWRILFPARTAPAPAPFPAPPVTTPAPLPAPAPAPAMAPQQVGPALPAVAAPPSANVPAQAQRTGPASASASAPAAAPRKDKRAVSGTVTRRGTPAEASTAAAGPASTEAAGQRGAPASAAADKLPKLADLPEPVRRGVPALAIGGAIYSPQPDARMVIVNGEVVREGQTIAPGLQLEQIRPRSAVFSIRGQQFEVPL